MFNYILPRSSQSHARICWTIPTKHFLILNKKNCDPCQAYPESLRKCYQVSIGLNQWTLYNSETVVSKLVKRLVGLCTKEDYPTSPIPILEPPNPWIDEFYVVQELRATDFKDSKIWQKGSLDICMFLSQAFMFNQQLLILLRLLTCLILTGPIHGNPKNVFWHIHHRGS